ncbi:MAG: CHASE3 domain-containing protein, partial [Nitrospirales bacterium]
MERLLQFFGNLPIARKLLLTAVLPVLALGILGVVTYRSIGTFAADEEQINSIYLVQRRAAEYMALVVDLESGFRGFVLTGQERFLKPYQMAQDRILTLGDHLEQMVHDRETQRRLILQLQLLVKRLMKEKGELIETVRAGLQQDALRYVEEGYGRAIMALIRETMSKFTRLEQDQLNEALAKIGGDRNIMLSVIMADGILLLLLMVGTLHLIARSITDPLIGLTRAISTAPAASIPEVPVLARKDEIGYLTKVMHAMGAQIRNHLEQVEESEAELRSLNQSLLVSESKYRSLVDHAPFGIFATRGLTLIFSNRHNLVLAGLSPDEDVNPEEIWQAIHPDDREPVREEFTRAAEEGRPFEKVFRFQHRDSTIKKVLSRAIPIRDNQGKTVMYQGFNVDITALDQMQIQLSRAERLATLGQVAAGIAHEIRNPLVGIGSTASLLLEEAEKQDPRQQDLETILKETRRLDRIVNQIVDFAKPRNLTSVLFGLDHLIRETLALLNGPLTNKDLHVACSFHPDLSPIEADRDQVKQVLLNLIQNGVDAMKPGGTLRLECFDCPRNQAPGVVTRI